MFLQGFFQIVSLYIMVFVVSFRYDAMVFVSSSCSVYLCKGDLDRQNISDQSQRIKSMVVSMLQNWSHRYYSHNSNIKCVGSIIKWLVFEPIHYAFSEFDYMFLSMYS